jgi:diketogulonate reductase-like aldo/keto reductase
MNCTEFVSYSAYANESSTGQGIAESGVPREQLFITSKCESNPAIRRELALIERARL